MWSPPTDPAASLPAASPSRSPSGVAPSAPAIATSGSARSSPSRPNPFVAYLYIVNAKEDHYRLGSAYEE